MSEDPKYIIHNSTVHSRFEHRCLVGYRPEAVTFPIVQEVPRVRWAGNKIPVQLWRQVLAFFKWSYDTTKSETQVRLFYNFATKQWAAHAFPQTRGTGMTTKELEGHPNRIEDMKQFAGYECWGTVHHHCSASAFQSGTDKADEESQAGIHITVGFMDKAEHDLHGRVTAILPGELNDKGECVRTAQKVALTPDLLDWFAIPDGLGSTLPKELHPIVLKHYVIAAAKPDEAFPERWKSNVIAAPTPVHQPYVGGFNGHGGFVPNAQGGAGNGPAAQLALALARRGEEMMSEAEADAAWSAYVTGRGWE